MISDFFTTLFVVYRSSWLTDDENNPYSDEVEVGSFNGHLQQANAELLASLGLTLTNSYSIWCPIGTDIAIGDTLDSVKGQFSVKAVQTFENGDNTHIQAVVQLDGVSRGS